MPDDHPYAASVFSTSLIQYDVPNTIASSLKLLAVMQSGAVAIAAEDKRARPRLGHVGEVLRAHQRPHLVHVGLASDFPRDCVAKSVCVA